MRVVRNTFPMDNVKQGDLCHWELGLRYRLIKDSDNIIIFSTKSVDYQGRMENGKAPKLTGVIAQVKSKGYILEIA